jgi:hypothetical protein
MAYKKRNFVDGECLCADDLNKIEDGIIALEQALAKYIPRETEVILPFSAWVGTESPYTQVVAINGITSNTRVDLVPTPEQLVTWENKNLTFSTENENGVVTVFAIGDRPQNDYIIDVVLTEVGA